MTDQRTSDEIRLIDFLRGELSPQERQEVLERLDADDGFRRVHDDIANALEAMRLSGEIDPPEGLVEATIARIGRVRRTEALLAKEEARRPAIWPTFSLRELTAVAAAVILMAAILVPSVRQARRLAGIGQCASQVGQIGSGLLAYANANDDSLPGVDSSERRWLPRDGQSAFSNSNALFKLVRFGYTSPTVFRCPAHGKGSFVVQAGMTDFPADRYISYSYQHTRGPRKLTLSDPVLAAVAEHMVILADSTPIFVDGKFRREKVRFAVSENHRSTGQNVLYLDMHVNWVKSPTVGVHGDNIFLVRGKVDYRGDEAPAEPTDTFLLPTFSGGRLSRR